MGVEIVTQPQRLFIRTFSLIAALLLITAPSLTASAYELIIGTGPDGSFSHHNGKLLCRLFTRQDSEMTCLLSESTDQIDNLTNVQGGSLDLALVDSLLLEEATSGRGAFEFLDISYDQIRILTPLYQVPLTLIQRRCRGNNRRPAARDENKCGSLRLPGKSAVQAVYALAGLAGRDVSDFRPALLVNVPG